MVSQALTLKVRDKYLLPVRSIFNLRTGRPDFSEDNGVIRGHDFGYPLSYDVDSQEMDDPSN